MGFNYNDGFNSIREAFASSDFGRHVTQYVSSIPPEHQQDLALGIAMLPVVMTTGIMLFDTFTYEFFEARRKRKEARRRIARGEPVENGQYAFDFMKDYY
jgi:hypothetical protein